MKVIHLVCMQKPHNQLKALKPNSSDLFIIVEENQKYAKSTGTFTL